MSRGSVLIGTVLVGLAHAVLLALFERQPHGIVRSLLSGLSLGLGVWWGAYAMWRLA